MDYSRSETPFGNAHFPEAACIAGLPIPRGARFAARMLELKDVVVNYGHELAHAGRRHHLVGIVLEQHRAAVGIHQDRLPGLGRDFGLRRLRLCSNRWSLGLHGLSLWTSGRCPRRERTGDCQHRDHQY